jgi:hypothetical protein
MRLAVAAPVLAGLLVAALLTAAVAALTRPPAPGPAPQAELRRSAGPPPTAATPPPAAPTVSPTECPTPRRMAPPRHIPTFTPFAAPTASTRPTRTPKPAPTPTATVAALYLAAGDDLAVWAGPGWSVADGVLANDGAAVVAEPWLAAPYEAPTGAYAVEADIRVLGVAPEHCEQSFGVVAGGGADAAWGGGVLFGCDGSPRARLTDVTEWTDGYNRDRLLAEAGFAPGDGWHAYRLEVDGDRLRLLVDGAPVLEAADGAAAGGGPGRVGLWSQGVRLEVRRVAVFAG